MVASGTVEVVGIGMVVGFILVVGIGFVVGIIRVGVVDESTRFEEIMLAPAVPWAVAGVVSWKRVKVGVTVVGSSRSGVMVVSIPMVVSKVLGVVSSTI